MATPRSAKSKAPKRKLKVFEAQIGFYDTVVAAPGKAAALRAWGVHQDLFAGGQARIAEDPAAVTAALAQPEVPLRRAIGSKDAFELDPAGLPRLPDAPKPKAANKIGPPPKPEPDRRALDAAEAALSTLVADRKREEAEFQQRQDALEAARADAQSAYVGHRKVAAAALAEARRAFRKA